MFLKHEFDPIHGGKERANQPGIFYAVNRVVMILPVHRPGFEKKQNIEACLDEGRPYRDIFYAERIADAHNRYSIDLFSFAKRKHKQID